MKQFSLSSLAKHLPAKEPKEFTIVFLSRPLRRGQNKIQKSTIITAVNRSTAYNKAVSLYGKNNVLSTKERKDIRTDNFVTVM